MGKTSLHRRPHTDLAKAVEIFPVKFQTLDAIVHLQYMDPTDGTVYRTNWKQDQINF